MVEKTEAKQDYTYELRIPKERIAVLIGKNGDIKKEIEDHAKVKLKVDSREGDIIISSPDSLNLYAAKEIVQAVGRGFNPEIALLLLKPDYSFEIIHCEEYAKSKNSAVRLKGRVIGEEGKSRRIIEDLTECYLSVYGKTIGIIGDSANVAVARRAVTSLLSGSPHASVYKFLEKNRSKMKMPPPERI